MWGLWWLPNLYSLRFRRFFRILHNKQQTNYFENLLRLKCLELRCGGVAVWGSCGMGELRYGGVAVWGSYGEGQLR